MKVILLEHNIDHLVGGAQHFPASPSLLLLRLFNLRYLAGKEDLRQG